MNKIIALIDDLIAIEETRDREFKAAAIAAHKCNAAVGESRMLFHLKILKELAEKEIADRATKDHVGSLTPEQFVHGHVYPFERGPCGCPTGEKGVIGVAGIGGGGGTWSPPDRNGDVWSKNMKLACAKVAGEFAGHIVPENLSFSWSRSGELSKINETFLCSHSFLENPTEAETENKDFLERQFRHIAGSG